MKTFKAVISGIILVSLMFPAGAAAKTLLVEDFESKKDTNLIGGKFGIWQGDPGDSDQMCAMSFSSQESYDGAGNSLYIEYDVDSKKPAYNGLWMKLQDTDLTPYDRLIVFVKGDSQRGFADRFKIELKNNAQTGVYYVRGITSQWQKMLILLKDVQGVTDWSAMTEFVIVFADTDLDVKEGAYFIDDIVFSDGKVDPVTEVKPAPAAAPDTLSDLAQAAKREGLEVRKEKDSVVITLHVRFDYNKSTIRSGETEKVKQVAEILKKHVSTGVRIEGHTDSVGSEEYNSKLSGERAAAVKKELVKCGLDGKRLKTAGMGEAKPIATNKTKEGRAKNRRVEFVIMEKEQK